MTSASSRHVRLKHEGIARELRREITSGRLPRGARLPGEVALAERFGVSRTTVRSALAQLAEAGLIATRIGKGSYVLYDGEPLDGPHGWARALTSDGVASRVRVLSVTPARAPELAEHLADGADVVVVEQVRELTGPGGHPVSYERATVPAVGPLADLPTRGLAGSLTAELAAAGLVPDHGDQRAVCRPLVAEEAAVLGREPGALFLHASRTSLTADDALVEHVDILLDPAHFELSLRFGCDG